MTKRAKSARTTKSLKERFSLSASDPKLGRVVGVSNDEHVFLTLWILVQEQVEADIPARLLFGWALPTSIAEASTWSVANLGNWKKVRCGGRWRMMRATLALPARTLRRLVEGLCEGVSLEEASAAAGLGMVPKKIKTLQLGDGPVETLKRYDVSPVWFHEIRGLVDRRVPAYQSAGSPSTDVPAWGASLVRLDKSGLWTLGGETSEFERDVAAECIECLENVTGLRFKSADAGRLGNLEMLVFPSGNEFLVSQIHMRCHPVQGQEDEREYFSITFLEGALPTGTRLMCRCKSETHGGRTLDELQEVSIGDGDTCVEFSEAPSMGHATLQVWTPGPADGRWTIWFENEYVPIRTIQINMGLVGLSGTLGASWLDEAKKSTSDKDAAAKVETIRQTNFDVIPVGRPPLTINEAFRRGRQLALDLHPTSSGGGFFPSGWGQRGKVSFVEWFLDHTKASDRSTVLLVDPYFDEAGVDIFARARHTQLRYRVLANTQLRTLPAKAGASTAQITGKNAARADRIRRACESIRPILRNLDFVVSDLKSTGGGSPQLFHDRYILLLDPEGRPSSGFQLSNSIQGATKRSPLLVTPIPKDILGSVFNYTEGLLSADATVVSSAVVEEIYNSRSSSSAKVTQEKPQLYELVRTFLAMLFDDDSLASAEPEKIEATMSSLSAGTLQTFQLSRQMLDLSEAFGGRLQSCPQREFNEVWSGFGEWAVRCHDWKTLIDRMEMDPERLSVQVKKFLLAQAGELRETQGNREDAFKMHFFKKTFGDVLSNARRLIVYGHRNIRGNESWSERFSLDLLSEIAPKRFVSLADELAGRLPTQAKVDDLELSKRPEARLLTAMLDVALEKIQFDQSDALGAALLDAAEPLWRALGAGAFSIDSRTGRAPVESGVERLSTLETDETAAVLAEWIGDLRVEANRANHVETDELQQRRRSLMNALAGRWPKGLSSAQIRGLVSRLSGPGEGSWSQTTTNEFLVPLVRARKLGATEVLQLWAEIFLERLESLSDAIAGGGDGHHFFLSTDGSLTETVARLVGEAAAIERETVLKRIAKAEESAVRHLRNPLAASIDYRSFANARDAAIWMEGFWGLVARHIAGLEMDELTIVTKKHLVELSKVLAPWQLDHDDYDSGILQFRRMVFQEDAGEGGLT